MRVQLIALALLAFSAAATGRTDAAPAAASAQAHGPANVVSCAGHGTAASAATSGNAQVTCPGGVAATAGPPAHHRPSHPTPHPHHQTVAAPRTPDQDAASVAHNFAVEHPLPFLRKVRDNHDLAARIRASLAAHPDGNAIIDPEQCRTNGSCASPRNFLESAQHDRPTLTMAQLADYIDGLQVHTLTAQEASEQWDMDCLQRVDDGQYRTIISCGNRQFHAGEVAYIDPETGRFELAHDCDNWVRGVHHEPETVVVTVSNCIYIDAPGEAIFRAAIVTSGPPAPSDGECAPAILPSGEDDYLTGWYDQCANIECNFADDLAIMGVRMDRQGSYRVTTPGRQRIRLPKSFMDANSPWRVWLCWTMPDGTESDTLQIEPGSFVSVGATFVATVYETPADVPAGVNPAMHVPVHEWHWDQR